MNLWFLELYHLQQKSVANTVIQTNTKQSWLKFCKAYGEILTCRSEYPNTLGCLGDFRQRLQDVGKKFQGQKQLKMFCNGVPAQHSLVSLVLRGFKHVFIVKGKCLIQQGSTALPSRTKAPFLFHKLFGKWTHTLSSLFSQYSLTDLDGVYSLNQLFPIQFTWWVNWTTQFNSFSQF